MEYMYDPLRASYRYEVRTVQADTGLDVNHGGLYVDGKLRFSTWLIDASMDVFGADPCSCGVEGCGQRDVGSGPQGDLAAVIFFMAYARRSTRRTQRS